MLRWMEQYMQSLLMWLIAYVSVVKCSLKRLKNWFRFGDLPFSLPYTTALYHNFLENVLYVSLRWASGPWEVAVDWRGGAIVSKTIESSTFINVCDIPPLSSKSLEGGLEPFLPLQASEGPDEQVKRHLSLKLGSFLLDTLYGFLVKN